jgi:hypothetical protein
MCSATAIAAGACIRSTVFRMSVGASNVAEPSSQRTSPVNQLLREAEPAILR